MRRQLDRGVHLTKVATLFFGYFLGALALGVCLAVVRLFGRAPGQAWMQRGHRHFFLLAAKFGLVRIEVTGAAQLAGPGPKLVVANHPSMLDAPLLSSLMPQADFVVNAALRANPFLAGCIRTVEYVSNDGGAEVVDTLVSRLEAGRCVAMFPEGTRSPREGMGPFHRGAAHVALRSGCDLTPVVVRMEPRPLMKGQKWYHFPERTVEVSVRVLPPMPPRLHLTGDESVPVAARRITAELRSTFERILAVER
jgi:1-acyl-sn-glycerol-3-phosphate acyltransferase